MAKLFKTERKIRFSHCDPAGIVYFVNFFDMVGGCALAEVQPLNPKFAPFEKQNRLLNQCET